MLERLITFGHGTATEEAFVELLHGTGVDEIVDIRSFPGSRHNPQFGREEMQRWLPEAGVGYRWMPELGGRRKPDPDSR
ncbi:MAG: DUF488 domain-containing protein, partial [Acidimicrobiales bacterium]|nr:DUF488 domain-containing protein [Acidimicrobiales bacterium]